MNNACVKAGKKEDYVILVGRLFRNEQKKMRMSLYFRMVYQRLACWRSVERKMGFCMKTFGSKRLTTEYIEQRLKNIL